MNGASGEIHPDSFDEFDDRLQRSEGGGRILGGFLFLRTLGVE